MIVAFAGSLTTLFVCMIVGVIGRKAEIFSDKTDRAFSDLLVKFTLPATVFTSMLRPFSTDLLLESAITFFVISAVFLAGLAAGALWSRLISTSPDEGRVWKFSLMFPNVTFLGFPVVQSIFGDEGMFYAVIVTMVFNMMAFSIGTYILNNRGARPGILAQFKQVMLAPAFVATLIGFFLFLTGVRLPAPVENGVLLVGNVTTPVAMLLIGSLLTKEISSKGFLLLVRDWRIYPVIVTRLVLIPIMAFGTLVHFISNEIMLGTIIILAAMPVATLTAVFAEQHGSDTSMAVKTIVVSNLLCIITLPFLAMLLI